MLAGNRAAVSGGGDPPPPGRAGRWARAWWALALAGVVLFVVGARWQLLERYGSDLPFHDQWDAEALHLLHPVLHGQPLGPHLWRPHNEHRPVLTKLLAYGLTLADGTWNARVQTTLNAVFAALAALALAGLLGQGLGRAARWTLAVALAVAFSLPLAWENLLWGFQTQFFLALLCGLAHLGGTWSRDRLGPLWIGGQIAGGLALLTIASGFASAAANVAVAAWRLGRGRGDSRALLWATLGVNLGFTAGGLALLSEVPGHAALKADSALLLFHACARLLAWPFPQWWWAPLLHLPLLLAGLALLGRRENTSADRLLLAASGWFAALVLAVGYGRGGDLYGVPTRYFEILFTGLALNAAAVLRLARGAPTGAPARTLGRWPPGRIMRTTLAAAWAALAIGGVTWRHHHAARHDLIGQHAAFQAEQAQLVRDYLQTGDERLLDREPLRLLHEAPAHLRLLLGDVHLRRVLPPSVRLPLDLQPAPVSAGTYTAFAPPPEAHSLYPAAAFRIHSPDTPGVAAVVFRSAPLPPGTLPWLRLRVQGQLGGADGATLAAVGADGRRTYPLQRRLDTRGGWRTVNLPRPPAEPFYFEIVVPAMGPDFAFTTPTDQGHLNRWSNKLLGQGRGWQWVGAVLLLGAAVLAWHDRRERPPPPAETAAGGLALTPATAARCLAAGALGLVALLVAERRALAPEGADRYARFFAAATWGGEAPAEFSVELHGDDGVVGSGHRAVYHPSNAAREWLYGTYTWQGDGFTGTLRSSDFPVLRRYLHLPLTGNLQQPSRLLLVVPGETEVTAHAGVDLGGLLVGETFLVRTIDTAGWPAGRLRLEGEDRMSGHRGWFGFARPFFSDDAAVGRRLQATLRASHYAHLGPPLRWMLWGASAVLLGWWARTLGSDLRRSRTRMARAIVAAVALAAAAVGLALGTGWAAGWLLAVATAIAGTVLLDGPLRALAARGSPPPSP
jgi:hypothetical protein